MCRDTPHHEQQRRPLLTYYVTDRKQFSGDAPEQRRKVLQKIREAAEAGVDLVQLRERDLSGRALEQLAIDAVAAVRSAGTPTRLLINSRIDIALACGADGVQLRSDDIASTDARAIAGGRRGFAIAVSSHTVEEVRLAWSQGADFAVFAPVFEKGGKPGSGLSSLSEACRVAPNFVLALGGITLENARDCQKAGAAGIAGIRLFQREDVRTVVRALKMAGPK